MATIFACMVCILYKILTSDTGSVIYLTVDMLIIICCALRFSFSQVLLSVLLKSIIFLTVAAATLLVISNIGTLGISDLFSYTEVTYDFKKSGFLGFDMNMISAPIALCFFILFVEKKYYAALFVFILLIFMLSRGVLLSLILTLVFLTINRKFRLRSVIVLFFSITMGYFFYFGDSISIIHKQVTILQGVNFIASAGLIDLFTGDITGQYTFNSYYENIDTSVIIGHTLPGTFALNGMAGTFPVVAVLIYLFYQSYMLRVIVLFLVVYSATSVVAVHFCLPILLLAFLKSRIKPARLGFKNNPALVG
tara:strand:+ start:6815 stop:7738 length:924 start_codon:yes stop_codon:yes gene_type:complete